MRGLMRGLSVMGVALCRGMLLAPVPQFFLYGAFTWPAFDGVIACENALHIAIQNRCGRIIGNTTDGASGRATNARQRDEAVDLLGETFVIVIDDDLGAFV